MKIPKHYRFKQEHKGSYEIYDARNKSSFHVAKNDLSLAMHSRLSSLPKMSDGGKVEKYSAATDEDEAPEEVAQDEAQAEPKSILRSDEENRAGIERYTNQFPDEAPDMGTPPIEAPALEDTASQINPWHAPMIQEGTPWHPPVNIGPMGQGTLGAVEGEDPGRSPAFAAALVSQMTDAKKGKPVEAPAGQWHAPMMGGPAAQPQESAPGGMGGRGGAGGVQKTPGVMDAMAAHHAGQLKPYDKEIDTINQFVASERQKSAKVAKDWAGYADAMSKRPPVADIFEEIVKSNKQFSDKLIQERINPNRYWEEMGTAGKVSSMIGLIFGGIGGGVTGRENDALAVINKAIDRDIAAQKDNRTDTMNLWKMNNKLFDNKLAAELATRQQMLATVEAQIKGHAALSGGPAAAMNSAPLLVQIEQLQQEGAFMQALTQGSNPGTEDQYARSMSYAQIKNKDLHKHLQERYIPNKGTTRVPLTHEDREAFSGYEQMQDALTEAQHFTQKYGTSKIIPDSAKAIADVMNANLVLSMNKLEKVNKISDKELHIAKQMAGDVGAWFSTAQKARIQAVQDILDSHRAQDYMNWGFQPFAQPSQQAVRQSWENAQRPPALPKKGIKVK